MRGPRASQRRLCALGIVALATAGCGDDAVAGAPDGGLGADAGAPGARGPEIPWLASGEPPVAAPVWACPTGWREVRDAEGAWCDPYPSGGALACAVGETHFPGDAACARVGPACPADGWPADLPTDRAVVYVREGATGGDGTRALPYGALDVFSIGGLPANAIIAVAPGRYDAAIRLPRGISIHGACATQTVLTSSTTSVTDGVLTVLGAGSEVRGLAIRDAERPAIWIAGGGRSVTLTGVWIEAVRFAGIISADGAAVTLNEVVVRGTRARADGLFGRALSLQGGTRVDVQRAVFEGNRETAIALADPGSTGTLADFVVRDTAGEQASLALGRGMEVAFGASCEITRALFERNRDVAFLVGGDGAAAQLADVVIRDTDSDEARGIGGRAIGVSSTGTLTLDRALLERNREVGIAATDVGTVVSLRDVLVRDVESERGTRELGRGVGVQLGTELSMERVVIARTRDIGLFLGGDGTIANVGDLIVRDTRSRERDGTYGRGISVQEGATLELARAVVEHSEEGGVVVHTPGSRARLTDVLVRDTDVAAGTGESGSGFVAQEGAVLEASRLVVDASRELGMLVSTGAQVTLADVVIRSTMGRPIDGTFGRGLDIERGGTAVVTRALFETNRDIAIFVSGEDSRATITDATVIDTLAAVCEASGACNGTGIGVGVYRSAAVTMTGFAVRRAVLCGLQIAENGSLDLADGEVSGCAIGACVQVPGYDFTRLSTRVAYRDNERGIEATMLPVPNAAPPFGSAR